MSNIHENCEWYNKKENACMLFYNMNSLAWEINNEKECLYPDTKEKYQIKWKSYRKKPLVVKAFKSPTMVTIPTLEGNMIGNKGDYIIQGVKGEYYPCKPDVFKETYEEVKKNKKNDFYYYSLKANLTCSNGQDYTLIKSIDGGNITQVCSKHTAREIVDELNKLYNENQELKEENQKLRELLFDPRRITNEVQGE